MRPPSHSWQILEHIYVDLHNHREFEDVLISMEKFSQTKRVKQNDNFRVQCFVYISIARINQHFMRGTYSNGLAMVPNIEKQLAEEDIFLDRHRVLVMNYKFAMLYFGIGDYNRCIDYLQRVINDNSNLRYDLQCYARMVHLMAHYELGNDILMESLTKSVYRFMARMQNLTSVEEAMFRFLRQSMSLSPRQLKPEFEKLLQTIKHLGKNHFQTRSFAYLDIISWIESKVYGKTMEQVVQEKYQSSRHR